MPRPAKSPVALVLVVMMVVMGFALYFLAEHAKDTYAPDDAGGARGSETPPLSGSEPPAIGATVVVKSTWICMPTKDGLDEIIKWSVAKDSQEMFRTMLAGGGSIVEAGDSIKLLDRGIIRSRVRVLKTGRECWVPAEAAR